MEELGNMNEEYKRTNWINGQTRVTADRMNNIEDGISKLFDSVFEFEPGPGIYMRKNLETGKYRLGLNYSIIRESDLDNITIDLNKIYLVTDENQNLRSIIIEGTELFINGFNPSDYQK